MIAVERVIAVQFPNWYRYRWKNRYRICLIGTAFTLTLTPSRDEDRRQKMVLSITAISVTLVSIPNVAVVLNEWKAMKFGHITIGVIYCFFGMHSALSIFVYAIFRPDFRKRLLNMLGIKRATNNVEDFTMAKIISK
ncbi:hypothetical protein Y032_0056g2665 [Ancylostoma ceylanicum]|nr:hypothetical protein Y032_0056g2665 [Ancylostoma ceylanicum]